MADHPPDLGQLPIPDWNLRCPGCGYLLNRLPVHRCPECGAALDVPSLVRTWTALQPPRYSGQERPLPDFGLRCTACQSALGGATGSSCLACGAAFELKLPRERWVALDAAWHEGIVGPLMEAQLEGHCVPFVVRKEHRLSDLYGSTPAGVSRIWFASEYYFDVLALTAKLRRELERGRAAAERTVRCECGEESPANFELCWNCGQPLESPTS